MKLSLLIEVFSALEMVYTKAGSHEDLNGAEYVKLLRAWSALKSELNGLDFVVQIEHDKVAS